MTNLSRKVKTEDEKATDRALRFLKSAPMHWQEKTKKLKPTERKAIGNRLDWITQQASMLSEYLDLYSECGHKLSVKQAMRQRVRVRKALGYSYPKQGVFPF